MIYEATLPLPPSVNRTYGISPGTNGRRPTLYLTGEAKAWRVRAEHLLREAGAKPLRGDLYDVVLTGRVYSSGRRDCDAGIKLTMDVACESFLIDDSCVSELHWYRTVVPHKTEYRLELHIDIGTADRWQPLHGGVSGD